MKQIVLLTDFSDFSFNATKYAIQAFGLEANYTLFHAYRPVMGVMGVLSNYDNIIEKQAIKELAKLKDSLTHEYRQQGKKLRIQTVAESGSLISALSYYIDHNEVDYVVLGKRGASGLASKLIGTNASNVATHIDVPILIVPPYASFDRLNKIVLAAKRFEKFNSSILEPLNYLAKSHQAEVQLLFVTEPVEEAVDSEKVEFDIHHRFHEVDHTYHTLESSSIEQGIMDFTMNSYSELLCVVAKHHDLIYRLFHKNLAESLSMHTEKPLLILKENY